MIVKSFQIGHSLTPHLSFYINCLSHFILPLFLDFRPSILRYLYCRSIEARFRRLNQAIGDHDAWFLQIKPKTKNHSKKSNRKVVWFAWLEISWHLLSTGNKSSINESVFWILRLFDRSFTSFLTFYLFSTHTGKAQGSQQRLWWCWGWRATTQDTLQLSKANISSSDS